MSDGETPIAQLMMRDPLQLTDRDIDRIIEDCRKSRSRFVLAGDKKVGTPAAKKSAAQKGREERAGIVSIADMDDLFKDL